MVLSTANNEEKNDGIYWRGDTHIGTYFWTRTRRSRLKIKPILSPPGRLHDDGGESLTVALPVVSRLHKLPFEWHPELLQFLHDRDLSPHFLVALCGRTPRPVKHFDYELQRERGNMD